MVLYRSAFASGKKPGNDHDSSDGSCSLLDGVSDNDWNGCKGGENVDGGERLPSELSEQEDTTVRDDLPRSYISSDLTNSGVCRYSTAEISAVVYHYPSRVTLRDLNATDLSLES